MQEHDRQEEFTYRVRGRVIHAMMDTGASAVLSTLELMVLGDDHLGAARRCQHGVTVKRRIERLLWRTAVLGRACGGGSPGNAIHRASLRFASVLGARFGVSLSSVVATFAVPVDVNRFECVREVNAAEDKLRTCGISVRREERVVTRAEAMSPAWQNLLPSMAKSDADAMVVFELHVAPADYWSAASVLRGEEHPVSVSSGA